jgi:transposase-like protein
LILTRIRKYGSVAKLVRLKDNIPAGLLSFVEIGQVKYLSNLIEQDHHFIETITNPMSFKVFHSAKTAIDGIETAYMI